MRRVDADVLIVGSGIAGLVLAKLVAPVARVTIVTKKEDSESSTNRAQGGIAAVLDPSDSFEAHRRDTLVAGDGLCDEEAVDIMVREGPDLVRRLVDWGARFSPGAGGAPFDLGREGGHSHRRIVHARDQTGREIERALLASVAEEPSVEILEHRLAVDLVTGDGGRVGGAVVLDEVSGTLAWHAARATVLATGGLGRIYRHTTNPAIATGDGLAMARRAGASLANLEMIQFHPTMFAALDRPNAFLVSEAVRGEGAVLRTLDGATFMERHDERGCLAPRDVVARAIAREMRERGDRCVHLDLTGLDPAFVEDRFPFIVASCRAEGVDPVVRPIPVVPAAHYVCGGIEVDRRGRTSLAGLYATGEVASTGVHGANRLASNSLLEALVWSRRAADDIASTLADAPEPTGRPERPAAGGRPPDPARLAAVVERVRDLMWQEVGIVRTDAGLARAERELAGLEVDPATTVEAIEAASIVETARLVVACARLRRESRGLHWNLDHPGREAVARDSVLRQ